MTAKTDKTRIREALANFQKKYWSNAKTLKDPRGYSEISPMLALSAYLQKALGYLEQPLEHVCAMRHKRIDLIARKGGAAYPVAVMMKQKPDEDKGESDKGHAPTQEEIREKDFRIFRDFALSLGADEGWLAVFHMDPSIENEVEIAWPERRKIKLEMFCFYQS